MNAAELARKHLDRKLIPLRDMAVATPPRTGWLRAIRQSLGMTTLQLGKRIGVVPSRISALEKAEVTGGTTLKSLREAAEAMGCTLVYAIVPTRPLDEIIRGQAGKRAEHDFTRVNHTMQLEDQALGPAELAAARARLIDAYLQGNRHRLWDDA